MGTPLTTEQTMPVTLKVVDGRDRPMPTDGAPVAVTSDPTVATVSDPVDNGNGSWTANIVSVSPGDAKIAFTVDAAPGPDVMSIVGTLDVTVTLDPRTGARMVALVPGVPVDEAV